MIADTFSQRFLGEQPGQVASISLLKKKKNPLLYFPSDLETICHHSLTVM